VCIPELHVVCAGRELELIVCERVVEHATAVADLTLVKGNSSTSWPISSAPSP
jgi:hypothetical protein